MGRSNLTPNTGVEYLSILDENGALDTDLEPQLLDETHLAMFRAMLLGRRFDERMVDLQRQGRPANLISQTVSGKLKKGTGSVREICVIPRRKRNTHGACPLFRGPFSTRMARREKGTGTKAANQAFSGGSWPPLLLSQSPFHDSVYDLS
mgnify:CR=1 FL=1